MSAPKYPAYKDSGADWLGEVPSHWIVSPFKWQIERNDGGVWGVDPDGIDDTIVLRSTEQTVDGRWRMDDPAPRKLSPLEKESSLLEEGDLIVTKSSGSSLHIGKTTLVTSKIAAMGCCYSNFMQRIRMKSTFNPKLAWYVMNNDIARLQFDLASNSTTGLANLNGTMIGEMILAVPSVAEQAAIASFLDRETAKIDTLVEEQKRLIELLKEKRQAVISQAVTKGLDPNVPMKDSGVEWLGQVPGAWKVVPLKWLCALLKDGTHLPPPRVADGVPLLSVRNVQGGVFSKLDDDSMISEENYQELCRSFVPQPNDVLLAIVGATLGKTAMVPDDIGRFHIQRSLAIFRPEGELTAAWLHLVFRSSGFQALLWESVGFSAQPGIYLGTLAAVRVPVPPIDAQAEIVRVVTLGLDRIDQLITEAETGVLLLLERRSALISAAVTGKIDVRGLVPH
ncbi:MAG: restriction endonuclease subunit S [Rubrivivax sp.]|nr:restriction endonuclease subunit S [Rubrivivax sp.]MBK8525805.1 restriction endonuclease subunit S [Rubrivivax sp.]